MLLYPPISLLISTLYMLKSLKKYRYVFTFYTITPDWIGTLRLLKLSSWKTMVYLCYGMAADDLGPMSEWRCCLTSWGNPIVEIRWSHNCLISTMGFPMRVRWHLDIESVMALMMQRARASAVMILILFAWNHVRPWMVLVNSLWPNNAMWWQILVNIGSGNALLPDGIKPLP